MKKFMIVFAMVSFGAASAFAAGNTGSASDAKSTAAETKTSSEKRGTVDCPAISGALDKDLSGGQGATPTETVKPSGAGKLE